MSRVTVIKAGRVDSRIRLPSSTMLRVRRIPFFRLSTKTTRVTWGFQVFSQLRSHVTVDPSRLHSPQRTRSYLPHF